MKRLGLLGGMSWESTAVYYRLINEEVRERMGGLHSAELILWSFDFARVEQLQATGQWKEAGRVLTSVASALEKAGAHGLVICTNTMHKLAEEIQAQIKIPIVHIADATAKCLKKAEARRPALLATKFTMEEDFYTDRLRNRHGIDVKVPDQADRDQIHEIIYQELCQGIIKESSKRIYLEILKKMSPDIDSVILGCSEIGLLLNQGDTDLKVFDTTLIHAAAAVEFACSDQT